MAEALIEVTGLTRRLGPRSLVCGVTFTLLPGEVIGLVGANGGGKTTTLRMLAGLLRPDVGDGQVLGVPVEARSRPWRRLGYMAQKTALYPELSVRENLRFRCDAFALPHSMTAIDACAAAFGLEPVLDSRVAHLSGGWAKRVQFAATTIHAPRLLLLDEPTAGLDAVTRRDLWTWIGERAAVGCGVVISTHDLAEAERLKRVIVYREGRAQSVCDPHDLLVSASVTSLETALVSLGSPS